MTNKKTGSKVFLIFSLALYAAGIGLIVLCIISVTKQVSANLPAGGSNWLNEAGASITTNVQKILRIVFSSIGAVICIIFASLLMFFYLRGPQQIIDSSTKTISSSILSIKEALKPSPDICAYCGSQIPFGAIKCINCGGNKKMQK